MTMLRLLPILLLLAFFPAAADPLATRLWPTSDNTRLVFESDKPLDYSLSSLESPARLIVDIQSPTGNIDALNTADLSAANKYLTALRVSRLNAETLRAVFDLSAEVNYQVLRLKPVKDKDIRHRLVIDLQPQQRPDPLLELLLGLQAEKEAPFVVLIDPGHGGEDPGAVSPNGNYEKHVVLKISHELADEINRRRGMKALLTRSDDRFIRLYRRVDIANRLDADVFISVHADSVKSRKARGSSVFILSEKGASTKFAKRLAQEANLSDVIGGADTNWDPPSDRALRALSLDGKDRASRSLALLILREIGKINKLHSPRVESAGFAVLKSPFIPSVLVETAFISHPEEEKKLLSAGFRKKLAVAIADAVQSYRDQYHVR